MKQTTANMLDSASRLATQMSWLLFVSEQEALLAAENKWRPGMPLYEHPQFHGSHARPLFSVLDDTSLVQFDCIPRCEDCLVFWVGPEPCWSCGEEKEEFDYGDYVSDELLYPSRDRMLLLLDQVFVHSLREVSPNDIIIISNSARYEVEEEDEERPRVVHVTGAFTSRHPALPDDIDLSGELPIPLPDRIDIQRILGINSAYGSSQFYQNIRRDRE